MRGIRRIAYADPAFIGHPGAPKVAATCPDKQNRNANQFPFPLQGTREWIFRPGLTSDVFSTCVPGNREYAVFYQFDIHIL
jgi:hypothetical protein